jgi:hypothetical protein
MGSCPKLEKFFKENGINQEIGVYCMCDYV